MTHIYGLHIDSLNMVSLHPVKVMGLEDSSGEITVDKTADLLLLNGELTLQKTFVGGLEYLIPNN